MNTPPRLCAQILALRLLRCSKMQVKKDKFPMLSHSRLLQMTSLASTCNSHTHVKHSDTREALLSCDGGCRLQTTRAKQSAADVYISCLQVLGRAEAGDDGSIVFILAHGASLARSKRYKFQGFRLAQTC